MKPETNTPSPGRYFILYYWRGPNFDWILWDKDLRAPISRMFSFTVVELQAARNDGPYLAFKRQTREEYSVEIPSMLAANQEALSMMENNRAGPDGENLTLEEILELYK